VAQNASRANGLKGAGFPCWCLWQRQMCQQETDRWVSAFKKVTRAIGVICLSCKGAAGFWGPEEVRTIVDALMGMRKILDDYARRVWRLESKWEKKTTTSSSETSSASPGAQAPP
jgi:hypothetical protein